MYTIFKNQQKETLLAYKSYPNREKKKPGMGKAKLEKLIHLILSNWIGSFSGVFLLTY
jgi:hypothetical protein